MRNILKIVLAPAAFAVLAGAMIAAPAKADLVVNPVFPFIHITPPGTTYATPPAYYYAPRCYWDSYGGRVCY